MIKSYAPTTTENVALEPNARQTRQSPLVFMHTHAKANMAFTDICIHKTPPFSSPSTPSNAQALAPRAELLGLPTARRLAVSPAHALPPPPPPLPCPSTRALTACYPGSRGWPATRVSTCPHAIGPLAIALPFCSCTPPAQPRPAPAQCRSA